MEWVGAEAGDVLLEQELDERLIGDAMLRCEASELLEQPFRKANRDGALTVAVLGDQLREVSIQLVV